jgi:dienelactone hydrolase
MHQFDSMLSRLVSLVVALVLGATGLLPALAEVPDSRLYELLRPLREPKATNYIREWLVCGEFPNPPHAGQKTYDHTPPCVGFETDYLAEHGGEAGIRPVEGMAHGRPDGTVAEWQPFQSDGDIVDFVKVFKGRATDNTVAYAFATVTQERATRQYLALGSDDGVRVWVNGKLVHDHLVPRGVVLDQDLVLVDFEAGENTLLLKVENGAGAWGFSCRLMEESALAGERLPFEPKLESKVGDESLVVRTNAVLALPSRGASKVLVEVVRPGGLVIAQARADIGKSVQFPTGGWPEGVYEVRCTMALGFGRQKVAHLPWFAGDAKAAGLRLAAAANNADAGTPEGAHVKVLDWIARDRAGDLGRLDAGNVLKAHSALMEFEELQLDSAGEPGAVRPYGFVRLVYADKVDGSPQYCCAYLPAGYDPARKWPLVLNLHGYNNDNPPYVKWPNIDVRHHKWADGYGLIVLEPIGRYNSWYKGIGVNDVLHTLELAKQRFSVDEDRVYLTGASMGGGGVWEIGTRHAGLFAALAPVYGGWDDRLFVDRAQLDKLTPRQRFEAESYSSFARAESLLNTPVFVNQGSKDEFVDVSHARLIVRTMQRWGYDVRYWEHLDKGHDLDKLGHEQATLEWLLQQRRTANPRRVRITAPELQSAAAHWVRVENRSDPLAFSYVDAEVIAPNFIRVNSENALALTLSPGGELVDPSQPLRVDWNGYGMPEARLVDGRVTLNAPGYVPGPLPKTPELAGPIRDVFATPFALVVGTTSDDPRMRALCERQATRLADEWDELQHCRPRYFKDTEISNADIQRYSLVLLGGPKENAVTKKLSDLLPVRFEGNTIELDGHAFDCPNSLLRMVYPHPLNRQRYVLLTAATSADAMGYPVHSRDPLGFRLLENLDFYLLDGRVPDPTGEQPDEKVCLLSGLFDQNWRYSEGLVVRGDDGVRQKCPQEKAPRHTELPKQVDTLYLSDLLEACTRGGFGDMARDASFTHQPLELAGQKYEKGLGLSCWRLWEKTSAVEWSLEGGAWNRLRGKVGFQLRTDPVTQKEKDDVKVRFFVRGDGKELFKTDQLRWNSPPVELEVPLEGVRRLRLEVLNEGGNRVAATSANWAEVRLEKVAVEAPAAAEPPALPAP